VINSHERPVEATKGGSWVVTLTSGACLARCGVPTPQFKLRVTSAPCLRTAPWQGYERAIKRAWRDMNPLSGAARRRYRLTSIK
jgi:hypothetical protein